VFIANLLIKETKMLTKITIDNDFPVTVLGNSITISPERRVLIAARTRAGKTTLLCHLAAKVVLEDENSICFIIGPNLASFCEDVIDKFESIPQLARYAELMDVKSIRSKATVNQMMLQFAGVIPTKPFIVVANADHSYISTIIKLIEAASVNQKDRRIAVFLDEAHKYGDKTYGAIKASLTSLTNQNVCLVETTATYMNRLLAIPPADVQILIPRHLDYVDPTEAKLIEISREDNNVCMDLHSPSLSEDHLDIIAEEWEKPKSLTLISGNQSTAFHEAAFQQCIQSAKDEGVKVAIVKINHSTAWYMGSDASSGRTITAADSRTPIRAASAIIAAVHRDGYNHIVVIGHKQVEMGQTIGCADLPMTLQILMVTKGKPKADNIAQWVRTGGNGVSDQRIMCPAEIWHDYCLHVQKTEELSQAFAGLTGKQQQKVAEELYFKLEHMRVDYGDYNFSSTKIVEDAPILTWLLEIPAGEYPAHFKTAFEYEEGKLRDTLEVRNYIIKNLLKDPRWDNNIPIRFHTIAGDANTKMRIGANDVDSYIRADPAAPKLQSWQRQITVWLRHTDSALCIRVRPDLRPQSGAIHDYDGSLIYPKRNILKVA
jgi:hypothetical protein